jgi:hypothetical protein
VITLTVRHQSYHTNLKIALFAGLLPQEIVKQIPKSTRSEWRKQHPSRYIGHEYTEFLNQIDVLKELSNCRAALATARAVLRLSFLVKSLHVAFDQISKIKIPEQKQKIVSTINRLQSTLGLHRCLKLLGITRTRFSTWSRNSFSCIGSPWGLCRRTHPNQLTKSEIHTIKQGVSA